ncbi:response regulator [Sunxiuqinia rutila]|uniref:hybrid sensor histidine kinase/response regulator transcription factor n=1 Tax=Sunxiuqinia rutila TaxID=1397841 RepID=UPI003D36FFB0
MMDKKSLTFLLFWFIVLVPSVGYAEELSFIQYRTIDGLSFNNVDYLAEDDEGLIYACTNLGLNIFDGTKFTVFNQYNTDGFTNKVNLVTPIAPGYILIGTAEKGLFVYNKFEEQIISLKEFFGFPFFSAVVATMDEQHRVWIGSDDGRLFCLDGKELICAIQQGNPLNLVQVDNLPKARINSLLALNKEILLGTDEGEIYRVRKIGNDFIVDKPLSLRSIACVYALFEKNKVLYVGTEKGIYRLSNYMDLSYNSEMTLDEPFCLERCIVRTISAHGLNLWVGTEGNGLFKVPINPQKKSTIQQINYSNNKRNGINSDYILSSLIDSDENLWIGTWFGGINHLDLKKQNYAFIYDQENENDIYSNIIWCLQNKSDDEYWVGTHGNGLCSYRLDENSFVQEKYSPELQSISSMYQTSDNNYLYVGTWGRGVKVYNAQTLEALPHMEKALARLADDRIYSILPDPNGNLWIGCFKNGLQRFCKEKQQLEPIVLAKKQIDIRFILIDSIKNMIWVASLQNGLFRVECSETWEPVSILHFDRFDGQTERLKPESLFLDADRRLWILSRNGMGYYDEAAQKAKKLTILSGCITTGMTTDQQGAFWVSSYNGIYKVNPENGYSEEMLTDHAFHSIVYNKKENVLLATSDEGVLKVDPDHEINMGSEPKIILSDLKILDQEVKPGIKLADKMILDKRLNYCDTLIIPHFSHTFSIRMNILSFSKTQKEKISYMLEGFEEIWNVLPGKSAKAVYTNVPPGRYLFKVKAANEYNLWSDERSLVLIKEKPWWGTNLAWSIYVIIVVGIIYWIIRELNIRVKIRQELRIERIKQEREHELYQQKAVFFTNISHDLRTPLTLIIGPLEEMLESKQFNDKVEQTLQRMLKNARMLLGLINQILDFRKAETNNLKLELKQTDLSVFLHHVYSQFNELAKQKKIDFDLVCPEDSIILVADPQKLESILFNLLSNAIKFTPSYGSILVECRTDDTNVIIRICDTGKGMAQHEIPNIFNRFYQLKPSGKSLGTGIGLNLVKRYMDLHEGSVEVQSSLGKGSQFTLIFPRGKVQGQYEEYSFQTSISSLNVEHQESIEQDGFKKEPVLVVIDDHQDILDYLKDILEKNYRVYTAINGKEGLSLVARKHPDLVISDIMMEDMDGLMVCKKIKSNLNSSHIPIILLTAKNALEDRIEGFDSGADEYIEKPFNSKLLLTRVRTLIEHRELIKRRFLLSDLKNTEVAPSSVDEKFMKQVVELIEAHINDSDFTVQSLVDEMKVSQDQLYRKIKALTGLSINHFIRLLRLKRAAQMLASGQYTVSEVVFQTGFNNPSYFTKCFKTEYGVLPSDFIQQVNE